VFENITVC